MAVVQWVENIRQTPNLDPRIADRLPKVDLNTYRKIVEQVLMPYTEIRYAYGD